MQTVTGTNSLPLYPERMSPPDISSSAPTLSLNGAQIEEDDVAPEVNYHAESKLLVHAEQAEVDDDDGRQSFEDTTGSITSVD
jgi:hypothetical protein